MKLMYAHCCGSLVVPNSNKNIHTSCPCGKTAVWWNVPFLGHLTIWDPSHTATVIGIHNGIFKEPYSSKAIFRKILDETSDDYLFKDVDSLIIHIVPGTTNDTRYAELSEHNQDPIKT